ncbi:hypothetical protein [Photorhabdus sp. RM157S]|uniref:hypothetical protein n=1 Tax=Photorhabdus TaxID=29487 RepID=UPI00138E1F64|nr:hypothetical protein [Photorhabdus thracensis]
MLALCAPLISLIPELSSRPADSIVLESQYLFYAVFFGGVMVFNVSMASYFNGIGKTRITFIAGLAGQISDIFLTIGLVFGRFGMPELGMKGSAIGTLLACMVISIIYLSQLLCSLYAEVGNIVRGKVKNFSGILFFRLRRGSASGMTNSIDEMGNTALKGDVHHIIPLNFFRALLSRQRPYAEECECYGRHSNSWNQ